MKNSKPMSISILCMLCWACYVSVLAEERKVNPEYAGDYNYGQMNKDGGDWVDCIRVSAPAYRSEVEGPVTVTFRAPAMTKAHARLWRQPTTTQPNKWGHDVLVMTEQTLDAKGNGTFTFNANDFPNGPINVRIFATNGTKKDFCELQLYNNGGVKWNQGIPSTDPVGAKGLVLTYADDFEQKDLSISSRGKGTRYTAHKPPYGDFSGWRFSHPDDFKGAHDPFHQVDSYLRIRAEKTGKDRRTGQGTGIISSVNYDREGFYLQAPFYVECKFIAQSAPGTWPAFWTLTEFNKDTSQKNKIPTDELDICELYGGVGKGNPNHPSYSLVTHFWRQTGPDGKKKKGIMARPPIMELGGKNYWSTTFHRYGVLVTKTDTVYYFDDHEVKRHPSGPLSASKRHYFMANLAIGGISGWRIDLRRYNNGSDMYIDYIRAYGAPDAPKGFISPSLQRETSSSSE